MRGVTHLAGPHPLEQDAQRLLVEIVTDGAVPRRGTEDGADSAAEALDESPLGVGISGADALHQ